MGGTTHGVGWGERKYHPGQSAGDNTDYGLGTLFLLEYLSGKGEGDDRLQEVRHHAQRSTIPQLFPPLLLTTACMPRLHRSHTSPLRSVQ